MLANAEGIMPKSLKFEADRKFFERYDFCHLSRAKDVWLPGGRPVFPGVPLQTPEALLASSGYEAGRADCLDQANGVTVARWQRAAHSPLTR